jgi:hypothetical protein
MKLGCVALCLCLLLSGGFASGVRANKPKQTQPKDEATEPSKRRPHRGMTKRRSTNGMATRMTFASIQGGEVWFYFFNRGHYFIPYYFGQPRTGTFALT